MKKVLAFDVDQTLNVAKTPIDGEIAGLLMRCLRYFQICPISGQKFEQFLVQIVDRLEGVNERDLENLHLFVAQGTQYYRRENGEWRQVYSYPLSEAQVAKISGAMEQAARELGYWEGDRLPEGEEIIENRLSQVTFSALGQRASTEEKYAWDPEHEKREKIVARAKELAPEFYFEIGGTTSINACLPGMNKEFGMNKLMEQLGVEKEEILYFGDMTQPGGNDYPVVAMGIETITVRDHKDTACALRAILALVEE